MYASCVGVFEWCCFMLRLTYVSKTIPITVPIFVCPIRDPITVVVHVIIVKYAIIIVILVI